MRPQFTEACKAGDVSCPAELSEGVIRYSGSILAVPIRQGARAIPNKRGVLDENFGQGINPALDFLGDVVGRCLVG